MISGKYTSKKKQSFNGYIITIIDFLQLIYIKIIKGLSLAGTDCDVSVVFTVQRKQSTWRKPICPNLMTTYHLTHRLGIKC